MAIVEKIVETENKAFIFPGDFLSFQTTYKYDMRMKSTKWPHGKVDRPDAVTNCSFYYGNQRRDFALLQYLASLSTLASVGR